jgi:hypothetical protein
MAAQSNQSDAARIPGIIPWCSRGTDYAVFAGRANSAGTDNWDEWGGRDVIVRATGGRLRHGAFGFPRHQ